MECPRCGSTEAAGSRFCDQCGGSLAAGCPSCGADNRPEARFCGTCGEALRGKATAPPGPPGDRRASAIPERRLVTVLFADLVGFTPFAEERDPEAVRDLLATYFERARLEIERHGGAVEKYIGDAVMAAWGTPIAHEDDAERAVRAALEIVGAVRSMRPGLEARIGILTGEAVVDPAATDQAMVVGDIVNTAARLQSVAPPGAVFAGEATVRAVGPAVAFAPVGEHLLKGKAAPVAAWQALRVVAGRGTGSGPELLEPPFVGRAEELDLLKDLLHATARERRPRLVSVSGVAGIGKSRLATELGRYVDGLVEPVRWHRGRSPSYGDGIAFWALGEMVRQRAGLAETDDEATTRAALRAMVAEHVPDEADRRWVDPAVLTLLGLQPPPNGGRDVLFAAWRILFERIAARGTTVLLFEDLQWADAGLLDFIDHLLANARGVPILVVTLARPELFDRRPDWLVGRRNATGIALEPLSDADMRELLASWAPGLPEPISVAILRRADGIPMYTVETIRSLLADGRLERTEGGFQPTGDLGALRVPETLHSLIASRLDAIDPIDRGLLQDAAVLGQTFSVDALAAVAERPAAELGSRLRGLVRREFLRVDDDPRSPERGQYGFVQSLVREVAYATLAMRERRARHLAIARRLEALEDPEVAGVMASHYLAALRASADGPDADALQTRARRALSAAADRAFDLGADGEAVRFVDQALSITDDPAARAELHERAAAASSRAGRSSEAMVHASAAIEIYRASGDLAAAAMTTGQLAEIQIEASMLGEAVDTLENARGDLIGRPELDGGEVRAWLEARLARARMRLGKSETAIEAADRALEIAERDRLEPIVAEALTNKGTALTNLGRWREGVALLQAAAELADRIGMVDVRLRASSNLAVTVFSETPERGLELLRSTMDAGRRLGRRHHTQWMAGVLAAAAYFTGRDWDDAIAIVDEELDAELDPSARTRLRSQRLVFEIDRGRVDAEALAEIVSGAISISDPDARAIADYLEGHVALVEGRWPAAFDAHARAARRSAQIRFWQWALAELVALWMRDPVRARAALAGLEAEPDAGRLESAIRVSARAGLDALDGQDAEATQAFRAGIDQMADFDWWQARVQMTAAMLLPDAPDAPAWAAAAREVFERCDARPYLVMLERSEAALRGADRGPTDARSDAQAEDPLAAR